MAVSCTFWRLLTALDTNIVPLPCFASCMQAIAGTEKHVNLANSGERQGEYDNDQFVEKRRKSLKTNAYFGDFLVITEDMLQTKLIQSKYK